MIIVLRKVSFLLLIILLISVYESSAEGQDYDLLSISAGEIIVFGNYEQDNHFENGLEPVEWLVLEKEEDRILIISKYGLDMKVYNESPYAEPWARIKWEDSSIRSWLNNDFYDISFSSTEKKRIINTNVKNGYTKYSHIDGGKDTEDNIFLLSIDEAEEYFNSNYDRVCYATPYCKAQGAWVEYDGACWWWLRSPGEPIEYASHIFIDGDIHIYGNRLSISGGVVRPALWLKLSSD